MYKDTESERGKELVPFKSMIDTSQLKEDIENGYLYILNVKSPRRGECGHFVFLTGTSDNCNELTVIDSANEVTEITEICGYRKFK